MKKKIITTSLLGFTVFAVMPASATEQIAYSLFGDPAYINSCNVCHTGSSGRESKGNLISAAKTAYNQDKWGLSGLKTFVAAATAPVVPTCSSTQILNTAKNVCETPAPVVPNCVSPQILNTTKNVCETPAPVVPNCVSPQILNTTKNVCETPAPVVPNCVSPQILNTTKNVCETPAPVVPVCKSTEVLTNNVCVAKPATVIPNCTGTQILNAAKTVCIPKPAIPVTPAPVPRANTKPVLNSVLQEWNVEAGQPLTIPLSVKDSEQDEFVLNGSVTGSKFSAVYTDPKSLLPTIDFQWTPTAKQINKIYSVTFTAKENKTAEKYVSNKVAVRIRVWPAGNRDVASISKFNVSTSAWKFNKLTLTGNVVFNNLLTASERQAFIAKKLDLTVTSGNTGNGALVATTPLKLDSNGNWSVSFPLTPAQMPCDITIQYEGQNAARTVAGCVKPAASVMPISFASRDDDDDYKVEKYENNDRD